MPDLENLDYEATLGVDHGGKSADDASASTKAPKVETPVTPVTTPETPAAAAVPASDDDIERNSDGTPILDDQGQPKRKMGGFQRRIEKLSRKLQEKDQELEFLRRYAMTQAPGGPSQTQQPATTQIQAPAGEPARDQFESHEEYTAALIKYQVAQGIAAFKQEQAKTTEQRTEQEIHNQFRQRIQQAPVKYKDWADVMEESIAPSTPVMDNIIQRSEFGVDMMYFLAKNEAESQRIAQLSDPMAQTMAMGALEDQFRRAATQTPNVKDTPQTSSAPAPITPVTTTTSATAKPVEQMDGDEYLAFMRTNKNKKH